MWPEIIDAIDKHAHGAAAKAAWLRRPGRPTVRHHRCL